MTKPLDPQRMAIRKLIKEARGDGRKLTRAWVEIDGKMMLGFSESEGAADDRDAADTWSDVK